MVRIFIQEVDLRNLTEVLRCLAAIGGQVLDRPQLELKEVKLPHKVCGFRSVSHYIKKCKSLIKKVLDQDELDRIARRFLIRRSMKIRFEV